MKLFFTTFFRKTFLLACFLSIIYHCFYFDIYDLPYLLVIKIALLIIAAIEFVGMILYLKDLHTKKRKEPIKHYSSHILQYDYYFTILLQYISFYLKDIVYLIFI